MFRKNRQHQQPVLICCVNELPKEQCEYLDTSWSGVFYREFFFRLDEEPFAVLYANIPSRPIVLSCIHIALAWMYTRRLWRHPSSYPMRRMGFRKRLVPLEP